MRKILLSLLGFVALGLLAGCGDHHHHIEIPSNPSGGNNAGFSNANLNGTYVFAVNGSNFDSHFANFAVTGTLTADGNGNITSGTRDTVDDLGHQTLDEAIAGTYFVNADGRGQAVLNGPSGQAIYRFVLESSSSGKLFQDGTTSDRVIIDAVGTLTLQTGAPATPTGSYIVRLDGEDPGLNTYGAIGGITFTGSNFNGSLDENDNGTFDNATNTPLAASGSITLAGSRGTATLTEPNFTHSLIVYFVSPTQVELLSADRNFFLYGEAEAQSSFAASASAFAAAAPEQVFSLSGFDLQGPRVEIGRMTLDPSGNLLNAIEDIETSIQPYSGVNLAGSTFAVTAGTVGRWTASLLNASGAPSPTLVGWQVSPQRSLVLTSSSTLLETGTMQAQTLGLNTASVSGDFAEALAGFDNNQQADLELTANMRLDGVSAMQGTYDSQDDNTGLNLDVATSGTYSIDPTLGRTSNDNANNNIPSIGSIPVVMYAVDAQHIDFLPTQAGEVYSGTLRAQAP
jgi:hypothetical protein